MKCSEILERGSQGKAGEIAQSVRMWVVVVMNEGCWESMADGCAWLEVSGAMRRLADRRVAAELLQY
jgi:hypothetical protein